MSAMREGWGWRGWGGGEGGLEPYRGISANMVHTHPPYARAIIQDLANLLPFVVAGSC